MTSIAVAARAISKRFGATAALRSATVEIRAGEIVALVGENGAGKSTLVRILGGVLRPDAGTIEVGGRLAAFRHPQAAIAAGITTIPQELRVAAALSVAENVLLGNLPRRRWAGMVTIKDWPEMRRRTAELLETLGHSIDPARRVGELAFAELQLVAIARALSRAARVLILDEPTASLENREVERLFGVLRSLRERRVAIVYISHRLEEVGQIADRCVVMRDGSIVANLGRGAFDRAVIVGHMTGGVVADGHRGGAVPAGAPAIEVVVGDDRLALHRHEILGIAGLLGSGASSLLRRIFGAEGPPLALASPTSTLVLRSPAAAVRRRIGLIPGERQLSLVAGMSIRDNIVLPHLGMFRARFARDDRAIDAATARAIELVGIRPSDPDRPVRELSGGNQQKVVFARWLMREFDVLLLDEPTQGIDIAAKAQLHRLIRGFAARGGGVLLSTSDMLELTALADRIHAMRRGRLAGELVRDGAFDEARLRAMLAGA